MNIRHLLVIFVFILAGAGPLSVQCAPSILVFGDSLSAYYGMEETAGWVHLLSDKLKRQRYDYQVVNASISGETSSGGRARIDPALKQYRPAIVILQLGANDGLRGYSLSTLRANLAEIIRSCQRERAKVLLLGMRLPRYYDARYVRAFENLYGEMAKQFKTALVPFMLENVASKSEYFQSDHLHPNVQAQSLILDNIWPYLTPLLK